jgi:hypothetical protein
MASLKILETSTSSCCGCMSATDTSALESLCYPGTNDDEMFAIERCQPRARQRRTLTHAPL